MINQQSTSSPKVAAPIIKSYAREFLSQNKTMTVENLKAYVLEKTGYNFTSGQYAGALKTLTDEPGYITTRRGVYTYKPDNGSVRDQKMDVLKESSESSYEKEITQPKVDDSVDMSMKIFISHSSLDKKYGDAFVELLESIGIKEEDILYSSSPRHGIPGDNNIFDYLRLHISKRITVFYFLSDNYYSSVYCLNEMGAAWVAQNDFSIFLLPDFTVRMEGVIDNKKKGYTLQESIDLIQIKNKLLEKYKLPSISELKWEAIKNKFLETIS